MDKYRRPNHANLSNEDYLDRLLGQTSYALFINSEDKRLREYLGVFKEAAISQKELPY